MLLVVSVNTSWRRNTDIWIENGQILDQDIFYYAAACRRRPTACGYVKVYQLVIVPCISPAHQGIFNHYIAVRNILNKSVIRVVDWQLYRLVEIIEDRDILNVMFVILEFS